MARNNQPLIIGAAALGATALLATLYTLFAGGGPPPAANAVANSAEQAPAATKTVFVATRDIPPRTQLTDALFESKQVPEAEVPPGAVTNLSDLRGLLSKQPIKAGDTATAGLTTRSVRRVVDANIPIPQGFRAVAIYVNPDQTAAGLVDVGDRVDIIATHRFNLVAPANTRIEGATQISTGRVIGQNLQVLAVDKSLAAPTPAPTVAPEVPGAGAPPPGAGAPVSAAPAPTTPPVAGADARTRVLLAAPLDIAARLVAAEEEGKLHIVIRNPSGADVFPVPEAREYPSRVVAVPVARPAGSNNATTRTASSAGSEGGGGSGSTTRRRRPVDDLGDLAPPARSVPDPVFPARVPSIGNDGGIPAPGGGGNGGNGGAGAPVIQAPPENVVTVIRGTEKTRILVPR